MFEEQTDTYAEVLKELDDIFSTHPSKNLNLQSTLNLFTTLRNLTDHYDCKMPTSDIIKIYGNKSFIKYYKRCLKYFVSEPKLCGLVSSQSAQVICFSKLHSSLWDICRLHCTTGYTVCERLKEYNVHVSLWRFVSCRDIVATICVRKSRTKLLVCWSFGILLHILTKTQVSVDSYRSCDGVHALLPFLMNCKDRKSRRESEYLTMCALLLLVSIVNEVENKSINNTDNYVEYLLGAIRVALKTQDLYSPLHRHYLRDMLCGLNRLTRFDANKRILLESHILGDIETILQIAKDLPNSNMIHVLQSPIPNTNSDNLATEGIRLLWQLCFISETLEQLPQYPSLLILCQEFGENSRSATCRETAEGLFWTLSKPLTNFESPDIKYTPLSATAYPSGHIVFACNRNICRHNVEYIMLSLKRRGYNVYSEPVQMGMEEALENASALILFLSYSFSTSPYCRQQVLSALSYGVALVPVLLESSYQPEAWLHYLLATVIYTPLTEKDNIEKATETLSRALTKYGIMRELSNAEVDPENNSLSKMVSTPLISVTTPWRSVSKRRHAGRGLLIPFWSESSNASTPTPSECPTISLSNSLQLSPFSTNTLRLRTWSCSPSQVSSTSAWSNVGTNFDDSAHFNLSDDQELILAYQAPSPSIREWDKEKVQRWLEESGLSKYSASLDWLDGRLLWELAWHRIRAHEAFFLNLEQSLNMPPQDQVILFNSLSLLADAR